MEPRGEGDRYKEWSMESVGDSVCERLCVTCKCLESELEICKSPRLKQRVKRVLKLYQI